MANIITDIRLSGITYQIQGEVTVDAALDSGSTNPVANSAITTALDDKVNVADNNVSAYTFEDKISGAEYGYSEHFAGPIYIRYTGSTSSSGGYYAGNILCYTSEWGWEYISLSFDLSDGQITATTVSSNYFDVEIENGEAALTFKDGYYLREYDSRNGFVALTKTTYESGQSADVIEDTVYDVFDKLNDKIDKTSDNAITGGSIYFSDGYLDLNLYNKNRNTDSSIKIDSSTIKSSNNGLSVQFETSEVGDKILNVGSGSYGTLFSTGSYNTSFNEFTITFNPNYTQSNVYHFSVRIIDASNAMYDVTFEYDSADMSAVYTYLRTYCTVTDTLSTDYKLKVTAKEGYKIARLYNSEYMVGGVDNTNPNNYISNLVTTPSYVHDGQDVIDDIYDKLDDKQDTLQSGTNIKTINNESILGSGNINIQGGGGKAVSGGTNISITTGETADTINCTLPISADTRQNGANLILFNYPNTINHNQTKGNFIVGYNNTFGNYYEQAQKNFVFGDNNNLEGYYQSRRSSNNFVVGNNNFFGSMSAGYAVSNAAVFGQYNKPKNNYEFIFGQYNNSVSASTTFGDSGNTLFSVGNGTSTSARHNAFEIRQNGDIYVTKDGQDVKLQDQLGGSSITVDTSLDSGSTNPVENRVIYNKFDEVEQVTAAALNELNDAISGKQPTLISGTNIKTINNESILGSGNLVIGVTVDQSLDPTSTNPVQNKVIYNKIDEVEQVTAAALNELNDALGDKQDTLSAGTNITIIDNVISATGGGTVESAITSGSTNAVESKAIWSATTYNKNILLTFDGYRQSTNYPKGCGKLVVGNIGSNTYESISFIDDRGLILGGIDIENYGNISVNTSRFEGATYEIDGTTVIISYPSTDITSVRVSFAGYTYTAVIEGAWVNENTYMKLEVDAIANGLQNSKLDATAYTPTVVDSALNVASTNPVQNQALYSELRIDNGETETTLTFENSESTNYLNGCTKLIVEVAGSSNFSNIHFYNDDQPLGTIGINNWGSISVNTSHFEGATYEIDGTTVIITYPTVTSVTKIRTDGLGNYVYKAIATSATPLKNQVVENTTALGGLSLVKLTQAEYNALATKDSSTLYVIVD